MSEILLSAEHLKKQYLTKRGGKKITVSAVDDVCFHLHSGHSYAIIGASGSGKSTLVKLLFGLEKPDQGTIWMEGRAGLVWQDPYSSLCPSMTIEQIVAEPLLMNAQKKPENLSALVDQALQKVHLDPAIKSRYPHKISGGQRQRVSIARALILSPKILILDEPTSMLDGEVKHEIKMVLEEIMADIGVLLVTHDIQFALEVCGHILVMQQGKIIEECESDQIDQAQHPYTQDLITASTNLAEYWQRSSM